jgi:membrane-associated phospholipid phosphatase
MLPAIRDRFEYLSRLREKRLIAALAVLFLLFAVLAFVARSAELLHLDQYVTVGIQSVRTPWLDALAMTLTHLGGGRAVLVAGIGALGLLLLARRPRAAVLGALALLSLALNPLLKELVGRGRPEEGVVQVILPASGLSFPSGHAMASLAVYGFLALMAWIHVPRKPQRVFWTALLALFPVCVGLSRIYLGAHWFSDVVAGWTIGLFWLLVSAQLYKALGTSELGTPQRP